MTDGTNIFEYGDLDSGCVDPKLALAKMGDQVGDLFREYVCAESADAKAYVDGIYREFRAELNGLTDIDGAGEKLRNLFQLLEDAGVLSVPSPQIKGEIEKFLCLDA